MLIWRPYIICICCTMQVLRMPMIRQVLNVLTHCPECLLLCCL